jgi:DNA primase
MLIVEGYMDYLTLWQAGIRNVAAVSGTAFTSDHAHLIKRFARKLTLVFDGDRAGQAAARRAAFVLAPFDIEVAILTLPGGEDPDSFVRREGPDAFMALMAAAKPAADFLIDSLIAEHGDSAHGKNRVVGELAPYAAALAPGILRDDFTARLAQRLRVDRRHVEDKVSQSAAYRPSINDSVGYGGVDAENISKRGVLGALDESFLRILLTAPNLIPTARQYVSPDFFLDTVSADVYSIVLEAYDQKGDLGGLHDLCGDDPEIRNIVAALLVKPVPVENIQDELVQKVLLLRKKFFKARIAELREELRVCPESDKELLLKLLKEYGEELRTLSIE